jgi:hypothetical protein
MMIAVILSRVSGKTMWTVYPDGQIIYSSADTPLLASSLLVSASGEDGQYWLKSIVDDISAILPSLPPFFQSVLDEIKEKWGTISLLPSEWFPQRVMQGLMYQLRRSYPRIQFSMTKSPDTQVYEIDSFQFQYIQNPSIG